MKRFISFISILATFLIGCETYSESHYSRRGGRTPFNDSNPVIHNGDFVEIIEMNGIPGPNTLTYNEFFKIDTPIAPSDSDCEGVCPFWGLSRTNSVLTNSDEIVIMAGLRSRIIPDLTPPPTDYIIINDIRNYHANCSAISENSTFADGVNSLIETLNQDDGILILDAENYSNNSLTVGSVEPNSPDGNSAYSDSTPFPSDEYLTVFKTSFTTAERSAENGRLAKIIFLSDTMNINLTSEIKDEIEDLVDEYGSSLIQVVPVGVGSDFDFSFLREIAFPVGSMIYSHTACDLNSAFSKLSRSYYFPILTNGVITLSGEGVSDCKSILGNGYLQNSDKNCSITLDDVYVNSESNRGRSLSLGFFSAYFLRIGNMDFINSGVITISYSDELYGEKNREVSVSLRALSTNGYLNDESEFFSDTVMQSNTAHYSIYKGLKNVLQFSGMYRFDTALGLLKQLRKKFENSKDYGTSHAKIFSLMEKLQNTLQTWAQLYPSQYGSSGASWDNGSYDDEWIIDGDDAYWDDYWDDAEYEDSWYDDSWDDDDYYYDDDDYWDDGGDDYWDDGSDDDYWDDDWDDDDWDDDDWDDDDW